MAEESTTPDVVEVVRRATEAANRRDLDAALGYFAPDAVWGGRELGDFEGLATIRGFWEDWVGAYEELEIELEEVVDLGNGVGFAVVIQKGRPVGSSRVAQMSYAAVAVTEKGLITRFTNYADIEEGRAAAKRLA